MKYFFDEGRAIRYVIPELVATLQDDIDNQKANGEPKRDYVELEDKIKDIEEVQPLMEAALDLLEACRMANNKLCELNQDAGDTLFIAEELDMLEKAINKAKGN